MYQLHPGTYDIAQDIQIGGKVLTQGKQIQISRLYSRQ